MKNLKIKPFVKFLTVALVFLVAALVVSRLFTDHGAPPPPPQPPHAGAAK